MNRAITAASLSALICFSGMSWIGGDQKHNSSAAGPSSSTDELSSLKAVQMGCTVASKFFIQSDLAPFPGHAFWRNGKRIA